MSTQINNLLANIRKEFGWGETKEGILEIRNSKDEIINTDLIADIKIVDLRDGKFLETIDKLGRDGYFGVSVCVVDAITGKIIKQIVTDPETGEPIEIAPDSVIPKFAFVKLKRH
ncbi:MAG: hypothetical protein HYT27_03025 [Parcubacteria group bacterium]|nr:hypothetical protein [Parcubacteria group bacterium]